MQAIIHCAVLALGISSASCFDMSKLGHGEHGIIGIMSKSVQDIYHQEMKPEDQQAFMNMLMYAATGGWSRDRIREELEGNLGKKYPHLLKEMIKDEARLRKGKR